MAMEAKKVEIVLGHVYTPKEMQELGFTYWMSFGYGCIYRRFGERSVGDCTDKNVPQEKSNFKPLLKYPVKEDQTNAAKS